MEAIRQMEENETVGTDAVYVEMLKSNTEATADLLTKMWTTVGKTKPISKYWLRGMIVPIYKDKGEQNEPANSRTI